MTDCSKIHSSGEFQSYVMMSGASNGKMGEASVSQLLALDLFA